MPELCGRPSLFSDREPCHLPKGHASPHDFHPIRRRHIQSDTGGVFVCRGCGVRQHVQTPCLLTVLVTAANEFIKAHGRCEENNHA